METSWSRGAAADAEETPKQEYQGHGCDFFLKQLWQSVHWMQIWPTSMAEFDQHRGQQGLQDAEDWSWTPAQTR